MADAVTPQGDRKVAGLRFWRMCGMGVLAVVAASSLVVANGASAQAAPSPNAVAAARRNSQCTYRELSTNAGECRTVEIAILHQLKD
jgi:hypothetical protein